MIRAAIQNERDNAFKFFNTLTRLILVLQIAQ